MRKAIIRPLSLRGFALAGFFPAALLLAIAAGVLPVAEAAPLEKLADSVQEFTLENGLRFLVVERHDAPVFSYTTIVDAGGVCEVTGVTGIAHMFEHMAFKGTETVGTTDYKKERKALVKVDAAWDAVIDERRKGFDTDSTRLAELVETYKKAREEAREFVVSNEFVTVLETNGARGVNAFTGTDMTGYLYSLPSNRLELWARMEADRLSHPVLREFYTERDVVRNERRSQESSPIGRLFDNLLTTAFAAHPYGTGVIGHSSDIEAFHRRDALGFFEQYYVATNMTVALVGDVTVDEVKKLAKKYFSEVRGGPDPPPVVTVEPVRRPATRTSRPRNC
jgi:predicted Zn-dependent peptidase